MPKQENINPNQNEFKPPKLPFGWLATTFIAPVAIAILPNVFTADEVSIEFRIILALALLSVMLFISCLALMLQLYDKAYTQQMLSFVVEGQKEELELLKVNADKTFTEYNEKIADLNSKLKDLENKSAEFHKLNNASQLESLYNELSKKIEQLILKQ